MMGCPTPRAAITACLISAFLAPIPAAGQEPGGGDEATLDASRTIEFITDEGTWLNLDVSPDGTHILFDLLGDLYLLPITGGEARAITGGTAWDTQARFSPDGCQIVFVSDRGGSDNLWLLPTSGGEPRALTQERSLFVLGSPSWSPDGRSVVARRGHGGLSFEELWIYSVEGGAGSRLPSPGTGSWPTVSGPVFSPDGQSIYYSASMPLPFAFLTEDVRRLQVMRMELSKGIKDQLTAGYGGGVRPLLSPDGQWLVYGTRDEGSSALRIRRLEDGWEDWLVRGIDRDQQTYTSGDDVRPGYAFTPDSRSVVVWFGGKIHRIDIATRRTEVIPFTARVRKELAARPQVTRAVETGPVQVRQVRWPAFSPDGEGLVFSALGKLWLVERPGGQPSEPRRLTDASGREVYPSFSPDGRWIAWASWTDSIGGHIWKMPIGGEPVRLTQVPGFYQAPVWSPDGARIAFVRGSARAYLARDWTETQMIGWVPASGGPVTDVARSPLSQVGQYAVPPQRLTWSDDGERLYFLDHEPPTGNQLYHPHSLILKSVDLRGMDERLHATIAGGEVAVPSPDGKWLTFSVQSNLYLTSLPPGAAAATPISTDAGPNPIRPITLHGGVDVRWAADGRTLTWGLANQVFRATVEEVVAGIGPDSMRVDLSVPRRFGSGALALRGARIITMSGDEVIDSGDLLVIDGRVAGVGPTGSVPLPAAAHTIDVSGKVIIPGLVDIHAHPGPRRDVVPEAPWTFAAHLAYGVTTAFDPDGFDNPSIFAYAEMIEAGELLGPRYFGAGRHLDPMVARIESLEDARLVARRYQRQGSIMLKEYLYPRREQKQWLRLAAEELGMNTSSEGAGHFAGQIRAALDGYTGFEHFLGVAPIYRDAIQLLARSGTYYNPTLGVDAGGLQVQFYFRQRENLHDDPKLARFVPHDVLDRFTRRTTMAVDDEFRLNDLVAGAAAIVREGGLVTVGGHEHKGLPTHWEIWAYVEGGMTPIEALRAATLAGAEALGMHQDLGSLEPGKIADLIVLDGDPLTNIRNTARIRYVMKAGELFDGDTLRLLWPLGDR